MALLSYFLNIFNFFIAGMYLAILSESLENATVHGLGHISRSKSAFGKAIWSTIVVACFAGAITMIISSYKEWQNSPVTTTITTHPITDLEFPAVTVCPPWRSNTALNHLLERVKDVNFTLELRQKLLDIAREVFIDIPNRKNGERMIGFLNLDNMRDIADGQIELPKVSLQSKDIFNIHYTFDLPDNIEHLIGDGQLVLDISSEEEWSYMLQDGRYGLYSQQEYLSMSAAEEFCLNSHSHLVSLGSQKENSWHC